MNRTKATTHDILGHYRPCIFKERFRYDPCRSCTLDNVCENYTPIPNGHQQTKTYETPELLDNRSVPSRNKNKTAGDHPNLSRPFYWYHSTVRTPTLPKPNKMKTIIWRGTDGGVI